VMSAIWHGNEGIPGFTSLVPAFSFYDQAQVEQPAPVTYQIAQRFKHMIQQPLGPDFRWQCAARGHTVWLSKRPWFCTFA